ncbi:RNA polymerase sigma-70 factor [Duncaniella freteri]|uniref:RNA polymerase sigma-70 factor n=1 Tax=Duncaniella freteri TaxID=2530391 RepID=UPI00136F4D92|nr:RNA polymerase sigma-70 factor [Duncaniella freteri]NBJ07757.1 RNA polymerase sigma-70 factor [Alistipes sp. Z76]NCE69800.1 RNA polymerase sigma-70 factor [Muribaculaceae bacterium M3]
MFNDFEEIFRRYYPAVLRFVMSLVKSRHDAEDIAQEVFSALWPKRDIWMDNPDIDRYIYRTARYMTIDHLRQKSLKSTFSIDGVAYSDYIDSLMDDSDALDPLIYNEAVLLLRMTLDAMPPKRRQIFSMSRIDGMCNKEIAEMTGLSVRTVESHLYTAIAELKKVFKILILILSVNII